ncbi:MAG: hypothetical protein LBI26_02110 [Holosporales bacterium]|jgi:hypothetical protein|nr:hypothetical protein [Holosporales bacterium]
MYNNRNNGKRKPGINAVPTNQYDVDRDLIGQHSKYRDNSGDLHDIEKDAMDTEFHNTTGSLGNLGKAAGSTLGSGLNFIYEGVGKVANKVGSFFKKVFTGKNPFK